MKEVTPLIADDSVAWLFKRLNDVSDNVKDIHARLMGSVSSQQDPQTPFYYYRQQQGWPFLRTPEFWVLMLTSYVSLQIMLVLEFFLSRLDDETNAFLGAIVSNVLVGWAMHAFYEAIKPALMNRRIQKLGVASDFSKTHGHYIQIYHLLQAELESCRREAFLQTGHSKASSSSESQRARFDLEVLDQMQRLRITLTALFCLGLNFLMRTEPGKTNFNTFFQDHFWMGSLTLPLMIILDQPKWLNRLLRGVMDRMYKIIFHVSMRMRCRCRASVQEIAGDPILLKDIKKQSSANLAFKPAVQKPHDFPTFLDEQYAALTQNLESVRGLAVYSAAGDDTGLRSLLNGQGGLSFLRMRECWMLISLSLLTLVVTCGLTSIKPSSDEKMNGLFLNICSAILMNVVGKLSYNALKNASFRRRMVGISAQTQAHYQEYLFLIRLLRTVYDPYRLKNVRDAAPYVEENPLLKMGQSHQGRVFFMAGCTALAQPMLHAFDAHRWEAAASYGLGLWVLLAVLVFDQPQYVQNRVQFLKNNSYRGIFYAREGLQRVCCVKREPLSDATELKSMSSAV